MPGINPVVYEFKTISASAPLRVNAEQPASAADASTVFAAAVNECIDAMNWPDHRSPSGLSVDKTGFEGEVSRNSEIYIDDSLVVRWNTLVDSKEDISPQDQFDLFFAGTKNISREELDAATSFHTLTMNANAAGFHLLSGKGTSIFVEDSGGENSKLVGFQTIQANSLGKYTRKASDDEIILTLEKEVPFVGVEKDAQKNVFLDPQSGERISVGTGYESRVALARARAEAAPLGSVFTTTELKISKGENGKIIVQKSLNIRCQLNDPKLKIDDLLIGKLTPESREIAQARILAMESKNYKPTGAPTKITPPTKGKSTGIFSKKAVHEDKMAEEKPYKRPRN